MMVEVESLNMLLVGERAVVKSGKSERSKERRDQVVGLYMWLK